MHTEKEVERNVLVWALWPGRKELGTLSRASPCSFPSPMIFFFRG